MNPQSASHNYRKARQKSGLGPLNYATVAPEQVYFYSTGLVCCGVIPKMLNQSHTTLNLQQILLSQIQKVVLLSTCLTKRLITTTKFGFIHPFQNFLMQPQQIVGSKSLRWEL
jgi:hypothetical protein